MDWKQDVEVMDSLTDYVKIQKETLNRFLNSIFQYNDGSPLFAFLQIYGVFINTMVKHLDTLTETESLELSLAEISNHPTVQNMVASMMQRQLDRGLNLD